MCGILGMLNSKVGDLLRGLSLMENRGYDSAGLAYFDVNKPLSSQKVARVELGREVCANDLRPYLDLAQTFQAAIGHTRWATRGVANQQNAHPHFDSSKRFVLVQNGDVLNSDELKADLTKAGVKFYSETDTEVIVNLVAQAFAKTQDLALAVQEVLPILAGSNAFVVFDSQAAEPCLIAANYGGTIVISDKAKAVISEMSAGRAMGFDDWRPLANDDVVEIKATGLKWFKAKRDSHLSLSFQDDSTTREFAHEMLREICEQPKIMAQVLRGRLDFEAGSSRLGGLEKLQRELRQADFFHFIACGSAYHAATYGDRLFNRWGLRARAWVASEFENFSPVHGPNEIFFFLSQSGETADTLSVLEEIKLKQQYCLGLVNTIDSRIARLTDAGVYLRAMREQGVAATKTYTAHLAVVAMVALNLARQRNLSREQGRNFLKELADLPEKMSKTLQVESQISALAKKYKNFQNFYFLGRSFAAVSADEGALKLKEVAWVSADAYPLREMKHGPLALVDENFVSVAIVPNDHQLNEALANLAEIKARQGKLIIITNQSCSDRFVGLADDVVIVPETIAELRPILEIVPLQFFAYFMGLELGRNPDRPRNLAKTVTVG